jgi:hypothetical protein
MPRIIGASVYAENFHGQDITEEEWTFMRAMEAYQRRWCRRYPSWREVLHVLDCLGYRKTAPSVPVSGCPPGIEAQAFAATARRAFAEKERPESAPAQLPV